MFYKETDGRWLRLGLGLARAEFGVKFGNGPDYKTK
jgi:hypothetical protein